VSFRPRPPWSAIASFWQILDARELPDSHSMASFIAACQFKYGGIAKVAGETPGPFHHDSPPQTTFSHVITDPYHTYLSLAALSICPPAAAGFIPPSHSASWTFENLDALLNGRVEVVQWIRDHVGSKK
jgi:geranylgeranyl transferase type-1 subunit beta